jgi:hypothetical protein
MEGILMTKSKIDPKWAKKYAKRSYVMRCKYWHFATERKGSFHRSAVDIWFSDHYVGIWPLIKAQLAQLKPTGSMVDED